MFDPADTIAAVASPPGAGWRGIVRLSGPEAWSIVLDTFTFDRAPPSTTRATRRTGALRVDGSRAILPAAVLLWPGSRSYTGQPSAELHTVGSPPLVALVLSHMLARGARIAEPGEFTLRAFLSGRIDLTRAEAVLWVIEARTRPQLDAALEQLAGGLAGPIVILRDRLLDVLAHLEANLDFVDEPDVDPLERTALAESLARGSAELEAMAGRLRSRDRPDGRPRVVLVGPPNAGKSRLFNALLGANRALVSPIPGTTRDYLSAHLDCDGLSVELIDTAGEDAAQTTIEARAQSLRADQAARADLLLVCRPADDEVQESPLDTTDAGSLIAAEPARLPIRTKSDLGRVSLADPAAVSTSAATGEGLETLRARIATALRCQHPEEDLSTTTGARCRDSLLRASEALASASRQITLEAGDELISVELRQAVDELGKVVGAVVTEDILDRIFSRFCIGK